MKKSTPKIEIRRANKDDAGLISLLGRVTFSEAFGHFFSDRQDLLDYCNLTFSVDKIENSFSKTNNIYGIAFVDRLAVGYAKLKLDSQTEFIVEDNVCQLQKIYVLKDFQSMKIGHELQNLLLKKAKEKGFRKVWLSALKQNERAIKFYLINGFIEIGNGDFQIGKEHFEFVAMSKQLD
jgi:ribosomal protein S18 acetylase RimI-like enzyme